MDEQSLKSCCELLQIAGEVRSAAAQALAAARSAQFEEADRRLLEAEHRLDDARALQLGMLQTEAQGAQEPCSLLLVHANDHIMLAETACESTREYISLYRAIDALKRSAEKPE